MLCWEVYREENKIFDHRRKTRGKNRKHLVTWIAELKRNICTKLQFYLILDNNFVILKTHSQNMCQYMFKRIRIKKKFWLKRIMNTCSTFAVDKWGDHLAAFSPVSDGAISTINDLTDRLNCSSQCWSNGLVETELLFNLSLKRSKNNTSMLVSRFSRGSGIILNNYLFH